MKKEELSFSLESVEFVLCHPWLFLYPAAIIMTMALTKLSLIPPSYISSAIISVESSGKGIDKRFLQEREDLFSKVLVGDNIKEMVKAGWPNLKEEENPARFNRILEKLRSPNGISMRYDKSDPRLSRISYMEDNPGVCYRVVAATVKTIIQESNKSSKKALESGMEFLSNQVKFYKDKLKTIDIEMFAIKQELSDRYEELTPTERSLITDVAGDLGARKEVDLHVQKSVRYDDMITKATLQLMDAEKRKKALQERLGSEDLVVSEFVDPQEDIVIKEYTRDITSKELEIASLISQGYMPEHPQIKKIQGQIDSLKVMKEKRLIELLERKPQTSEVSMEAARKKIEEEIKQITLEEDSLKDQIELLTKYQKASEAKLAMSRPGTGVVSERVARYVDLKKEKEINDGYYKDLRKQLEEVEIKRRLEKQEIGMRITVVEPPKIPLKPIPSQKIPKILMSVIIALGMGTGLAYFANTMDDSVRTSAELRELSKVPILASIDRILTPKEIMLKKVRRNFTLLGLLGSMAAAFLAVKILTP